MGFRRDFAWGAATSSYQIEGAWNEDGKGPSVWDVFSRTPGRIWGGQNGDTACDHYHRYREDVALMRDLGLKAYRFSLSWPRILPEGTGRVNPAGLDFYARLVDELLSAGIEPWITLYHWDGPQALYERGGWRKRESAEWFAEYAGACARTLSDRVRHWMTFNEPQCFVGGGYTDGNDAPGEKATLADRSRIGHNVLRAHGLGVQALRAAASRPLVVGYAPMGVVAMPATDDPADIEAARRDMFAVKDTQDGNSSWWMDPVYLGHYPEDGLALRGADGPPIEPGDMETIRQPLDLFCVNIYGARTVAAARGGEPERIEYTPFAPLTAFKWGIFPSCLYWGPRFYFERYKLPVVITENGISNVDFVHLDGKVHDPQRIDFMQRYLRELRRAVDDGVDVRGYFHWSMLDNLEWNSGFSQRFGLVHVDFRTLERTPKDSYAWYREVIRTNGASL